MLRGNSCDIPIHRTADNNSPDSGFRTRSASCGQWPMVRGGDLRSDLACYRFCSRCIPVIYQQGRSHRNSGLKRPLLPWAAVMGRAVAFFRGLSWRPGWYRPMLPCRRRSAACWVGLSASVLQPGLPGISWGLPGRPLVQCRSGAWITVRRTVCW